MPQFRYCLNTSTIRTTSILKKIEVASKAGYNGIELWYDDLELWIAAGGTLRDLRQRLNDHGLEVPALIHLKNWFQTVGEEYSAAVDAAKRKFEQAAELEAPYCIAGPPHGTADRKLGASRYAELIELARGFGVLPALEYLGFVEDIRTIEDALDIINRSGADEARIVLDPFHCHSGGGSIETIGTLTGSQIAISHFNDAPAFPEAVKQRDPDRVMPGDGVIDLRRYCTLLASVGYSGFLSLELFRPDLWELDPLDVAEEGLRKMKQIAEG
ncbi:MAG: sugar phosphate isomerase/epimerase family protein [Planctomyces sp.]|jgi:sugar phosphate isomerase/epimerase